MASEPALVANTDSRWFDYLSGLAKDKHVDEVNFWRPESQSEFRALSPGQPFFLRLKSPANAIAGYGFYVHASLLPIRIAWDAFGERNGDPNYESFLSRIAGYRRESPRETALSPKPLMCIILREVHLLPPAEWIPWGAAEEWSPNIVAFKGYDLSMGVGQRLRDLLRDGSPEEITPGFQLLTADERARALANAVEREGQGAFRVRVIDAYGRRCAVTGERSLPVLDAAHIQSYLGPASNHLQNGLSLRADIHRLFDAGYVTVTPEYRFEVSRRLKEDFENGEVYYRLDGSPLLVLPPRAESRPSREALEWHSSNVYRG